MMANPNNYTIEEIKNMNLVKYTDDDMWDETHYLMANHDPNTVIHDLLVRINKSENALRKIYGTCQHEEQLHHLVESITEILRVYWREP
jgi:hypothetical protein